MIRPTLDANVLVSAISGLANPRSTPGELLRRWRLGAFDLAPSDYILEEVSRALRNRYFGPRVVVRDAASVIEAIETFAVHADPTHSVRGVAPDPDDEAVIATALSSGSQVLVTGDELLRAVGHLEGLVCLTPREFLDVLKERI